MRVLFPSGRFMEPDKSRMISKFREGRSGRIGALAADHRRRSDIVALENDRHLAARPDEVRLDDLQHEARSSCRVEGIAAALEHGHRDSARNPMGGCDRTESAAYFGAGGEFQ